MTTDASIASFWRWWPDARLRIANAISTGQFGDLAEEISSMVNAIHDGVIWELGPGFEAEHAFCLSAQGDPELRVLVERWLRSAPAADETWEYHPARQANPGFSGMRLDIAGHELAFSDLSFAFEEDESRERIDVAVHHPAFSEMPENLRGQITFIALDNLLGEDGVERWLGNIEAAHEAPDESVSAKGLLDAIEQLSEDASGESWAVLEGKTPEGHPVFVTANLALKRIDYPLHDVHGSVTLLLREPNAGGLTTTEEARVLNELEDQLIDELGDAAVQAGRETKQGRRTLHFYAPESGPAPSLVDAWVARHPEYQVEVSWTRDPRWQAISAWS